MVMRFGVLTKDLALTKKLIRDKAQREYPVIQYYREVQSVSTLDDIHLEIEEVDRTYLDPIELYMLIKSVSDEEMLTVFGEDTESKIIVQIPTVILEDADLATVDTDNEWEVSILLKSGDKFTYGTQEYYVLNAGPDEQSSWLNTKYALFCDIQCELYREISTSLDE